MKEISIDEAKIIRKEILNKFDYICKKNALHYSLGYGTLLGAVRHKDMIPWDDDIDVVMPRKDFEILSELSLKPTVDRYQFINHRNHPEIKTKIGYYIDFNTITAIACIPEKALPYHGIHIDVYPIDQVPDNVFISFIQNIRRRWLQIIIKAKGLHPNVHTGSKRLKRQIIKSLFCFFNEDTAIEKLNNLCKKYSNRRTPKAGVLVEIGSSQVFGSYVMDTYTDYEYGGRKYKGFADYDECLSVWYGDYMTPPPVEKQILPHNDNVKYYWKE